MGLSDTHQIIRVIIALAPVLIFLTMLKILDNFKLLKMREILLSIFYGALAALVCYFINRFLLRSVGLDPRQFSRLNAPIIEETIKGLYIIFLIRSNRVGFRVDSAIYGFAIGTGFALLENISYLNAMPDASMFIWFVRGFGTAIMHGGTTAIFSIIAKTDVDQRSSMRFISFFPGLATAMIFHGVFNHFFLPPLIMTLLIILVLPTLFYLIFRESERAARHWMDIGFDTDQELLKIITTQKVSTSRIGIYLQSLKKSYSPEIILDMFCYIRVYLELSIKAKALLMVKEAGLELPIDSSISPLLNELDHLEKNIGEMGKIAISTFMSIRSQDIWQLRMLTRNKLRSLSELFR